MRCRKNIEVQKFCWLMNILKITEIAGMMNFHDFSFDTTIDSYHCDVMNNYRHTIYVDGYFLFILKSFQYLFYITYLQILILNAIMIFEVLKKLLFFMKRIRKNL